MPLEPWIVRLVAGLVLVVFVWRLFRFSMDLRYAKVLREEARRAQEDSGRRVVAEIPLKNGELLLFLEDEARFSWGRESAGKTEVAGARLLLSGALVASVAAGGAPPELPGMLQVRDDGREHWQVMLDLEGGARHVVECGSFREGISREAASRVFEAVKAVIERRRAAASSR